MHCKNFFSLFAFILVFKRSLDSMIMSNEKNISGKSGTYFNRKKSSGGLGAGAIVGIILACLAVLIAIICTIVCLNKRASTAAVVARQSESNNHIQISSMSGQYPVKV